MDNESAAPSLVVVGIDGSEGSRRALRWAMAEADDRGRPVRAVTVWLISDEQNADKKAADQLARMVAEVAPDHPDVPVDQLVVAGDPAQVLCEQSERAGLLVVGSRGLGTFTRLLLGSVSSKCAHHSRCPVIIVPDAGT